GGLAGGDDGTVAGELALVVRYRLAEKGGQIPTQAALEFLPLGRGQILQRREPGLALRASAFAGLAPSGQDRLRNHKRLVGPIEVAPRPGNFLGPERLAMRLRRARARWRAKADRRLAGDQARQFGLSRLA